MPVGSKLKDGRHVTPFHRQLADALGIWVYDAIECVEQSHAAVVGWTVDQFVTAQSEAARYRARRDENMKKLKGIPIDRPAEWFDVTPQLFQCGGDQEGSDRYVRGPVKPGGGLQRYGGDVDGAKWLCKLDQHNVHDTNCVIYSLGSYGVFDFEEAMLDATTCHMYSFDCSVPPERMPKKLDPRIHFEPVCIGDDSTDGKFQSVQTITKRLGHSSLSLLKMDIEGYEYGVVSSLYRSALANYASSYAFLPSQMGMEIHLHLVDEDRGKRATVMLDHFQHLLDMGYVPVSREYNLHCQHCEEWVFVRLAHQCFPKGMLPIKP